MYKRHRTLDAQRHETGFYDGPEAAGDDTPIGEPPRDPGDAAECRDICFGQAEPLPRHEEDPCAC